MLAWGAIAASTLLHEGLLRHCMRAPSSFYDTTPLGRVLNRFSKDVDTVDVMIPMNFRMVFMCTFEVVTTVVVISVATPAIFIVIAPLGVLYFFVQVVTSRGTSSGASHDAVGQLLFCNVCMCL